MGARKEIDSSRFNTLPLQAVDCVDVPTSHVGLARL
jgi:hypothetical protein